MGTFFWLQTPSDDKKEAEGKITLTPAKHIRSLHLSGEPRLVPDTINSCDEIEATPTIIPDSPTNDNQAGLFEDDEEMDVAISLRQHNIDKCLTQGRSESQSFHLKLTPSQDDDEELSSELPTIQVSVTSPVKLKVQSTTPKVQVFAKKPLFFLQKPMASMEDVDINEESEGSMSVFKRVKSGNLTPQKTKRVQEDSNEFLETTTLKRKLQIPDSLPSSKKAASGNSKTLQKKPLEGETSKWSEKGKKSFDEVSSVMLVEDSESVDLTLSYEYEAPYKIQADRDNAVDHIIISSPEQEVVHLTNKHLEGVDSTHQQSTHVSKENNISVTHEKFGRADDMDQMTPVRQPDSEIPGSPTSSRHSHIHSKTFTKIKSQVEHRSFQSPEVTDCDKTASAGQAAVPEMISELGKSLSVSDDLTNLESTSKSLPKSKELQPGTYNEVFTRPSSERKIKPPQERRTSFVKVRLRKKTPIKKADDKSSSNDESICKAKPTRPLKLRLQAKRKSKSSLDKDAAQDQPTAGQQVTTYVRESAPSGLENKSENLLSKKSDTNPYHNPQPQSVPETAVDTNTQNIRQRSTVNFSDNIQQEGTVTAKQQTDGPDVERRTVTRTVVMTYTVTLKTKTQVFNSKGELLQTFEKSEILLKNESESGPMEETHQNTEHSNPIISPSRTSSTMTTGDLADISSSSMSRTFSSGSKTSIPSLDAIPSSQVLPKQHSTAAPITIDPQHSSGPQGQQMTKHPVDFEKPSSDPPSANSLSKVNMKRHSGGSTTGPDLFGTPNQSIIDRADSQLGQIVSSSHSTPLSNSLSPKSYQNTSAAHSVNEIVVRAIDQQQNVVPSELPQRKKVESSLSSDAVVDKTPPPPSIENPSSKSKKDSTQSSAAKVKDVKQSVLVKLSNDQGDSVDLQSTGFSLQGLPPSKASGDSVKNTTQKGGEGKSSSSALSQEISLQGKLIVKDQTFILADYKSKVEIGAKVMGRWKDGFYYPGILSKIDASRQKFVVKYDDGSQSSVKSNEIILAAALPVGQSVLVLAPSGFYEPGMVMGHSRDHVADDVQPDVIHLVERDDGEMQRCERKKLILSEDQAACLLSSVEGLRISSDVMTPSHTHPGDVSLDNLVEGKRVSRVNKTASLDKPSTSGVQTAAASDPQSDKTETEVTRSGRKRKLGPVATSTPTPKQLCRKVQKDTPKKVYSPLGSAVTSPSEMQKTTRRAGLFKQTSKIQSKLFEGMTFILTHIEKDAQSRLEEKQALEGSSLDTSADENTDVGQCFVFDSIQYIL